MTSPGVIASSELAVRGFVILRDAFSQDEVRDARDAVRALAADTPEPAPGPPRITYAEDGSGIREADRALIDVAARDQRLLHLVDHPNTLPVIERALEHRGFLAGSSVRRLLAGEEAQAWHSDVPFGLRRQGAPFMLMLVVPLTAFTRDNGATQIVSGSHLLSVPRYDSSMEARTVQLEMAPGDAAIFDGRCLHRAGTNGSQERRDALFYHYRLDLWFGCQFDSGSARGQIRC